MCRGMSAFNIVLLVVCLLGAVPVQAESFNFQNIRLTDNDEPLSVDRIRIHSVTRLYTTTKNDLPMVELSGLAWNEDAGQLYAVSDHGTLFVFRPQITNHRVASISLEDAFPLRSKSGDKLEYPWSDSEGLSLVNGNNGRQGDEELLISFENKPRLQWHALDGAFLRKQDMPKWMRKRKTYYKRGKALESVTIHPARGIITAPEYPLDDADWNRFSFYFTDGKAFTVPRDNQEDMAVCGMEVMPDGSLLVLQRHHSLLAPTWVTRLERLKFAEDGSVSSERMANFVIGESTFPVDNYEGLAHHEGNFYFMISDDNEHFMQQTLLVYFEVLD